MYGFIDESGTAGVKVGGDTHLGVAMVIFDSLEEVEWLKLSFVGLREMLRLGDDAELHAFEDSKETQNIVLKTLAGLNFHYIYCVIEKDKQNREIASYKAIAQEMVKMINRYHLNFKIIRMDRNPDLKKKLESVAKKCKTHLHCREVRAKSYDGVQLADYIVHMATREEKGLKINKKLWKEIKKKQLV